MHVGKRVFDISLSFLLIILFSPIFLIIFLLIKLEDGGPGLYFSRRIGRFNLEFLMPKFRSMKLNTPQLATHLLENPSEYTTIVGKILRKTPQLMTAPSTTIDVAKSVAAFSPIERYVSPAITDPKRGPKIKNSINVQPFIVFASSIKIEFRNL